MIQINLLPVREWRRKEAVHQQISIFVLSLILMATIFLAIWITVQGKLSAERQELIKLEKEKSKLSHVDSNIKSINKKRLEIENKFRAIERLRQGRTFTVKILDNVVSSLPLDRLWLTNLRLKGNNLELAGIALDNHTVALFMRRLEASSICSSVHLKNTSRKPVQGHDLMEFGLQVKIKTPREKPRKR